MPIHASVLRPRPREIGKIKIGRLSETVRHSEGGKPYRPPERLNHFIITKTVRKGHEENFIEDADLMEKLPKEEDGKIRMIPIVLDSDIVDEVFPTTLACYAGRALHCRGTGKGMATRFEINAGRQTGKTKQVPCKCSYLTDPGRLVCKPHGTLWCTVHAGDTTRIGVRHSFRTTSWNSIAAILAGLDLIRETAGTICGIPLFMMIGPTLVRSKEGVMRTIQVVHVELATHDLLALKRHVLEASRTRHDVAMLAGKPLMLGMARPAGDQETVEEQAAVQQEWHPEERSDESSDDEGEEGELEPGKDFDEKTGEVFDVPFTEKEKEKDGPAPTTVPASQLGKHQGYATEPKPGAERLTPPGTTSPVVGFDDVLPADDPMRPQMGKLLKELAGLRGFSDEDMKKGVKEIFADVIVSVCGASVPFTAVRLGHAMKVVPELQRLIADKRRDLEPEPEEAATDSESAEDTDDIPTG